MWIKDWEFALRFSKRIARFMWAKERKSYLLVKRANHSWLLFCKSEEWREQFFWEHKKGKSSEKRSKREKKNMNFSSELLMFWERFARIQSESLMTLFFTEWREWFARGHSFIKSNNSDSLSVVFFKEQGERFAHGCSFLKSDESN